MGVLTGCHFIHSFAIFTINLMMMCQDFIEAIKSTAQYVITMLANVL